MINITTATGRTFKNTQTRLTYDLAHKLLYHGENKTIERPIITMLSEKMVHLLAEKNGWTSTYVEGYMNGKTARKRGDAPSTFLLIGIDEYCLGYRAGYYSADRTRQGAKEKQA